MPRKKAVSGISLDSAGFVDSVLDAIFDGAYLVDRERRIQKWNRGAYLLTGFSSEDVVGRKCYDNILMHMDGDGNKLCLSGCPLQATLSDGLNRQAIVYLRHRLGYRVPVSIRVAPIIGDDGQVLGAMETFRVADEPGYWKARTTELEGLAFVDTVTGIPNRRFLETQIDRLLHEFQSAHEPFILCMLDLDHFKMTNDQHGHATGDSVLRLVGQTLLNCMRSTDIVGRWGGDEFLLLLPRTTVATASQILERTRIMVAATTLSTDGGPVTTNISIGASLVHAEEDQGSLLRRADRQLYLAKEQGRNCCRLD